MTRVPAGGKWRHKGSGPVVRPYAVTGGRTEPAAGLAQLGAITVVRQRPADQQTGNDVLQEILHGLRAL